MTDTVDGTDATRLRRGDGSFRRPFIVALGFLIAISALTIDIVLPAIPAIRGGMGATDTAAQLVITFYLAGFALGQLPTGLASDRFGRLPVILTCLGVFVIAGAVGALSRSIEILIAARLVQGFFGAVGAVVARAIVRDVAGKDGGAVLMAVMTAILGLAPLLGPVIGGALTSVWGWRSTVLASVIFGAITIILIMLYVPETHAKPDKEPPARQLARSVRALLASRQSLVCVLLVCLPFAGYLAMITSSSTVVMGQYGIAPFQFGLVFAIAAAGYSGGALITRALLRRRSPMQVLAAGIAVLGLSALALIVIAGVEAPPLWAFWGAVTVFVFGVSMIAPVATTLALEPLQRTAGFTAAVMGTAQIGAGVVGSALSAFFYAGNENSMSLVMACAAALTVATYLIAGRAMLGTRRHR